MNKTIIEQKEDPYKVTSERLNNGDTELTGFFFHRGANFYVFSYGAGEARRHTLIDTADPLYRETIFSILRAHSINPQKIERIIISHRHHDHCGLADTLAQKSGAKILAHANFRKFVDGPLTEMDRLWLRGFEPSRLRQCHVEYLAPLRGVPTVPVNGLEFPLLSRGLPIGEAGHLDILACPESATMHSPDQVIVHYLPEPPHKGLEKKRPMDRPANHILFAGDLWLMHGPLFSKSFRAVSLRVRMASRQLKGVLSGQKFPRRDPRLQDLQAKEALKHGFSLIRVMPGHGEDFIGTRLVPLCFLCDRDLLVELGFSMEEKKSTLNNPELAGKAAELRGKAYSLFLKELAGWQEAGYQTEEIVDLLTRIYKEQEGGGPLVKEDRKERRQIIKNTLARLRQDPALGFLADQTLEKIKGIP
ncbi:MAG: MBL fold metallo-hydrolase [Thermodesulfobacteriota bacterium]